MIEKKTPTIAGTSISIFYIYLFIVAWNDLFPELGP